ncbi:hypothetical protein 32HC_22 [Mycobacterium phage 32HC]|uniref:Tail assembly chaperone n=1 Tax=Mycobacterium phage 32HC TaxID=1445729 RepID=W8EH98_9CAUD|nr:tail assembly chaperone [Mycobacterium phage 32HC]AHJ86300.1 hypothetical protein 32HC_22 [Mycobacterium phage 32HC]
MSSDAARLEALGEPDVRFVWRRHELTVPRALEDWPLDLIRAGRYVDAVAELLNGQTAPVPLYRDLVSLSDAMAAAVGVERLPETKPLPERYFGAYVFGAVPQLLDYLDNNEDDIASDLKTFRNVDYLDRWRGDLTLRQIWVYVRRLPPTSALAIARNGGHELWTKQSILTAQVWEQIARQPYVGRPLTVEEVEQALAKKRANEARMSQLAEKEDYYSPEASRARLEAARARKAARAAGAVATGGISPAPAGEDAPPPAAMSAMDKAMAARRRELQSRKAG